MPRKAGDRPDVVPAGAVNFAFLGQFAESTRDTIFTIEYSVRTGMEAAYQLLGIDRGVPEVFDSTYDVRKILAAAARLRDGKEIELPGPAPVRHLLKKRIKDTEIAELLKEFGLVS
jgi:oleate hydratase